MKKLITQSNIYIDIVIISLILSMFIQEHILLQWLALSMLWGVALVRLRTPNLYYSIIKDKAFLAYLLFVIWAVFSSFFLSSSKALSISFLIPFIGGLLSYFIGYTNTESKSIFFYNLLLGLGLLLVTYTFYQAFILDIKRPSGVLANWNTHAALLVMILLPCILRYTLKPGTNIKQLLFWCIVSLLFTFALGLTLSRGVFIIFITVFCCYALFMLRHKLFFKKSILILLSLILGYILNSLFINETVLQRLAATSNSASLASLGTGRDLLWSSAWEMYLDSPFSGWGLGVFLLLFKQYKDPLSINLGMYAHNDYLQFLLELGPIGLLLFTSLIFILLKRLYLLIFKNSTHSPLLTIEAIFLLSTCIGMLIHTFFTFHLYQLTMQIIFGYYLGQVSQFLYLEQGQPIKITPPLISKKFIWIYRIFCTLVIFHTSIFGLSYYYIEESQHSKNKQEILDNYSKLNILYSSLDRYDAVSASYLLENLTLLPMTIETAQKRQQISLMALNAINTAIDKMPLNPDNYIIKAEILKMIQGDLLEISEQYEKALKLDPSLIKARDAYAHYLAGKQEFKKALTILWDAWERVYVDSYHNGLVFLRYQLELNNQYANSKDSLIIEREIQRLTSLKKNTVTGKYFFHR